ncbi:MAG TPA: heparinase II/III family protein, partial [Bacteroidota bacterium]|nr:heparinase II/III family protein [Bacteroidota bacterium]
ALLAEVFRRRLGKDITGIINYPGTVRYGLRMWMPTATRPNDCVNFSDAWEIGDVAVAAWTAGRFNDPTAQYVATKVGQMTSPWSAIWLDPAAQAAEPGEDLEDVRFSNDWVVSRSGWGAMDGAVAMRSGGPANHEHADRNSVVFKAHGERIYHDPFHAAYPRTDPMWILRLTASHTALLIDGKGHQYHDGREGTNASFAEAHVTAYRADARAMVVTSDATAAYRLVNKEVALVTRTLVYLKPDVILIIDRVKLTGTPLAVQARFQVDNSDGKGSVAAEAGAFLIRRPLAVARTLARGSGQITVRTGALGVPASNGTFPYAEVESAPATDHTILTLCAVRGADQPEPTATVAGEGTHWRVTAGGGPAAIDIDAAGEIPTVTIR